MGPCCRTSKIVYSPFRNSSNLGNFCRGDELNASPVSESFLRSASPRWSHSNHSNNTSISDTSSISKDSKSKSWSGLPHEIHHDARAERYIDIRANALEQRRLRASSDEYPYDMVVLYQFWSHYLVRNFNTRMFEEFQTLAEEDLAHFDNIVGMQSLVNYYTNAMLHHTLMPTIVTKNLVRLVEAELTTQEEDLIALKTLQAVWRHDILSPGTRKAISDMTSPILAKTLGF
jgi:hypothetical protein